MSFKTSGLIKIVLLVVVFSGEYATEKRRNERKRNLEKIQAKIKVETNKLLQMIKDRFNKEVICYNMSFDEDMLCARGRRDLSKYGLYPGIAFIAHIYEE